MAYFLRIGAAGGGRRTAGRAEAGRPRRTEGKERKREAGTKEASALGACWLSLSLSREMVAVLVSALRAPRSSRSGEAYRLGCCVENNDK